MGMDYTAEEVREEATLQSSIPCGDIAEGMLRAYAADLDRRAEGVTDATVDRGYDEFLRRIDPQAAHALSKLSQYATHHAMRAALTAALPVAAEPAQVDVIGALEPLVRELETIDVPGVVLQQITLLGKFAAAARKLISEAMNARPSQPADSGRAVDWREKVNEVANNIGESLNAGCDQDAVDRINVYVDELFALAAQGQGEAQPPADWRPCGMCKRKGRSKDCTRCGGSGWRRKCGSLDCVEYGCDGGRNCYIPQSEVDAELARQAITRHPAPPASPAGVPDGFLPNGTRVMWQSSNGTEFPATITAYNPATYDALLDDGCDAKGFDRRRFKLAAAPSAQGFAKEYADANKTANAFVRDGIRASAPEGGEGAE